MVKTVHTIVWAALVGCILAIPVMAWRENFAGASILILIILIEVVVLVANGWRCPLTDVAGRFTTDRRDNFDIYLPLWLARHNKTVFGTLFVLGLVVTCIRWLAP